MSERNSLKLLAVSLTGMLALACAQDGPASPEDFSIRVAAPGYDAVTGMESSVDLAQIDLEDSPVIALDDIRSYDWDEHAMWLSSSARARLSGHQTGQPFVVSAMGERVYAGVFWSVVSSMSTPVASVFVEMMDQEDYPVWINRGVLGDDDPRADPRIRQVLEDAGKLQ